MLDILYRCLVLALAEASPVPGTEGWPAGAVAVLLERPQAHTSARPVGSQDRWPVRLEDLDTLGDFLEFDDDSLGHVEQGLVLVCPCEPAGLQKVMEWLVDTRHGECVGDVVNLNLKLN